jgi:hypothetical protein
MFFALSWILRYIPLTKKLYLGYFNYTQICQVFIVCCYPIYMFRLFEVVSFFLDYTNQTIEFILVCAVAMLWFFMFFREESHTPPFFRLHNPLKKQLYNSLIRSTYFHLEWPWFMGVNLAYRPCIEVFIFLIWFFFLFLKLDLVCFFTGHLCLHISDLDDSLLVLSSVVAL